ncbi:MAG: hypothetical protein IT422_09280 [Pirellulaceae bacterium]|jgi:hypothetical protein|nr:hypothetical protein [Pirellulaceae bacterium]
MPPGERSYNIHPTIENRQVSQYHDVALNIHSYMERSFSVDGAIIGPDPGVRFNYRIWRFLKGYTPWIAWNDGLYYLQCQGYWVMANWLLSREPEDRFAQIALAASDRIVERQRADGAWDYPNPEWKGRVATVEGTFASFALLEAYRHTGRERYLQSALRYHDFFSNCIGFQEYQGTSAVNYFAGRHSNPVPNNSSLILRYLANLAQATGEPRYADKCKSVVDFLLKFQRPSGELPYVVDEPRMLHFQCFQYHSFIYLDTWNYYRMSGDERVLPFLQGVLRFLEGAVHPSGYGYYQCDQPYRTVNYHTAAIATALVTCDDIGLSSGKVAEYRALAQRAYQYLYQQQQSDGSFTHSRGDYRFVCDHRRYPRYLAMMLYHLLCTAERA